ncbi:MAG: hypothetical protein HXY38_13060 [Chloroflexi bacterium]|nr:hypothetical protein [Chloroflexota bacterium]
MRLLAFFIALLLLTSCAPAPTAEPTPSATLPYRISPDENPFAPQIEDIGRQAAVVTITAVNLSERYEFSPPRSAIRFVGYMPSVCNELRIEIAPPDEQYRVFINIYSLINPDVQCDNVFQQFEAGILLGTYSPGRYSVWVNGSLVGDFVSY